MDQIVENETVTGVDAPDAPITEAPSTEDGIPDETPPTVDTAWHRAFVEVFNCPLGQDIKAEPDGPVTVRIPLQNGPLNGAAPHGFQIDDVVKFSMAVLIQFNKHPFNNVHNARAIEHLRMAVVELEIRTKERLERGAEGTSAP